MNMTKHYRNHSISRGAIGCFHGISAARRLLPTENKACKRNGRNSGFPVVSTSIELDSLYGKLHVKPADLEIMDILTT